MRLPPTRPGSLSRHACRAAVVLVVLAFPSLAAASDVTLAAELGRQFARVEADARAALRAKPAKQLRAYTRLNRDAVAAIAAIRAQEPASEGGEQVQACELASLARYRNGARSGISAAKALAKRNTTKHRKALRTARARIAAGEARHDDCVALGEDPEVSVTAWGIDDDLDDFEFSETVLRMPQGTFQPGATIAGCGDDLAAVFVNADFTGVRPGIPARMRWTIDGVVFFDFQFVNDRYAGAGGGVIFRNDLSPMPNGVYRVEIFLEGMLRAESTVTRAC